MKLSTPTIAVFVAVFSLSACGGGSSSDSAVIVSSPAMLIKTDIVVGTGATLASGATATVTYTGWLYNASAADFKGKHFDAGILTFVVGRGSPMTGLDQGVIGMKVGGTRVLLIPSAQAYGANAPTGIPANSGLVFEVKLTAVL